jgi:hypothetical protein
MIIEFWKKLYNTERLPKSDPCVQILGRNPDKSHKSFRPCYSQSPPQLCLEISISSNSRNLFTISTVQLLYTVKEKVGKPDRKPNSLPYGLTGHGNEAVFWGFCRNWFLMSPLDYLSGHSNFGFELAEIFVFEKRLPAITDTESRLLNFFKRKLSVSMIQRVVDSPHQ